MCYSKQIFTCLFVRNSETILFRTSLCTCYKFVDSQSLTLIRAVQAKNTYNFPSPAQINLGLAVDKASKINTIKFAGTNVLIVIGSVLLFNEWSVLTSIDIVGMISGILIVICGIRLVVMDQTRQVHKRIKIEIFTKVCVFVSRAQNLVTSMHYLLHKVFTYRNGEGDMQKL